MTTPSTQNTPAPGAQQFNPFAVSRNQNVNEGTVAIEEQRAIAEAQGKILIAKKFKRDQAAAFQMVMTSCSRRKLAESAMYSYPKGGQVVTGPSIRLAEELARAWGNMEYGIRELSQKEGLSEMEAYCWDLETNVVSSQKFTVKHERHTKHGVQRLTDPRDIYELTANNAGRRLRARILAVLPPDLVDAAVEECFKTLAGASTEPLEDRVRKMLKAFTAYGVKKEHIEARLGKPLDSILSDEFVELQTIYTSLKDNMSKPSDWFGVADATAKPVDTAVSDLNQKVEGKTTKRAPKTVAETPASVSVSNEPSPAANPQDELM
jgi:hypothetical protein